MTNRRFIVFVAALLSGAIGTGPAEGKRQAALVSSTTPLPLPGERLFPESVAIDPAGEAFVSSMSGGVVRVSLNSGKARYFIAPGAFGTGPLFGVFVDTRNELLWTCSNEFPGLVVAGADAGSWLKGFDLRTGKGRVSLKLPGAKPICNDIAVGPGGAVYVTDTRAPRILRWLPGADALEIWLESETLGPAPSHGGLDGIAFGGDGELYLNNIRSGKLYRVTLTVDGKPDRIIELKLSRSLNSPDGMRSLGGGAFVLAEGDGKISRITVDGDFARIDTLADGIREPTSVDSYKGTAWFVQGHLSVLFRPGTTPPPALPFKLTPIALQGR